MRITILELARYFRARRSWSLLPILTAFLLLESLIALRNELGARLLSAGKAAAERPSWRWTERWGTRAQRWIPSLARENVASTKGDL